MPVFLRSTETLSSISLGWWHFTPDQERTLTSWLEEAGRTVPAQRACPAGSVTHISTLSVLLSSHNLILTLPSATQTVQSGSQHALSKLETNNTFLSIDKMWTHHDACVHITLFRVAFPYQHPIFVHPMERSSSNIIPLTHLNTH